MNKQAYIDQLKDRADLWKSRAAELKAKAQELAKDNRIMLEKHAEDIDSFVLMLESNIEKLNEAGKKNWRDIMLDAEMKITEKKLDELKKALNAA